MEVTKDEPATGPSKQMVEGWLVEDKPAPIPKEEVADATEPPAKEE